MTDHDYQVIGKCFVELLERMHPYAGSVYVRPQERDVGLKQRSDRAEWWLMWSCLYHKSASVVDANLAKAMELLLEKVKGQI